MLNKKEVVTMIHHPVFIHDAERIEKMLINCEVMHLALRDGEYNYVVPMNYGVVREGDTFTIYMHSTGDGRKLKLIRADGRAGFEASCFEEYPSKKIHCSMSYESVAGNGMIYEIDPGEECVAALNAVLCHYGKPMVKKYSEAFFKDIRMLKLVVKDICGKELREENASEL